jgi:hypothetical protein
LREFSQNLWKVKKISCSLKSRPKRLKFVARGGFQPSFMKLWNSAKHSLLGRKVSNSNEEFFFSFLCGNRNFRLQVNRERGGCLKICVWGCSKRVQFEAIWREGGAKSDLYTKNTFPTHTFSMSGWSNWWKWERFLSWNCILFKVFHVFHSMLDNSLRIWDRFRGGNGGRRATN